MELVNLSLDHTWEMQAPGLALFSPLSVLSALAMTAIQKFVEPSQESAAASWRK